MTGLIAAIIAGLAAAVSGLLWLTAHGAAKRSDDTLRRVNKGVSAGSAAKGRDPDEVLREGDRKWK